MIDLLLHSDKKLLELVATYGTWVYGILFAIIFAETGLVVTPFLPGDSLLFATGALCATGALRAPAALGVVAVAAFTGNAVNYAIGRAIGPRVFRSASDPGGGAHPGAALAQRLLNREHLNRAHAFFEEYGGKAVILGRFVPVVRTFVPFVAGAAQMPSSSFVLHNFVGAAAWTGLCVGAGVLFGNVPAVKNNFSLVTIGIVFVSVLPMVVEFAARRRKVRSG